MCNQDVLQTVYQKKHGMVHKGLQATDRALANTVRTAQTAATVYGLSTSSCLLTVVTPTYKSADLQAHYLLLSHKLRDTNRV